MSKLFVSGDGRGSLDLRTTEEQAQAEENEALEDRRRRLDAFYGAVRHGGIPVKNVPDRETEKKVRQRLKSLLYFAFNTAIYCVTCRKKQLIDETKPVQYWAKFRKCPDCQQKSHPRTSRVKYCRNCGQPQLRGDRSKKAWATWASCDVCKVKVAGLNRQRQEAADLLFRRFRDALLP